jgi:hypothetical protein
MAVARKNEKEFLDELYVALVRYRRRRRQLLVVICFGIAILMAAVARCMLAS